MGRARRRTAAVGSLGLLAALGVLLPTRATAHPDHAHPDHVHGEPAVASSIAAAGAANAAAGHHEELVSLPQGFADVKVISGISEATSVDFAPDGTAFVALKTGVIK